MAMAMAKLQFAFLAMAVLVPMAAMAYSDSYFDRQPEWLQDYCVADRTSNITVSGMVKCKSSSHVKVTDFLFTGLNITGNTNNSLASAVTPVFVAQLAALNGLGLALARLDYAIGGVSVPHTHPRASELLLVLKGTLYAGFVNTTNHLFATTLYVGDVFVFPKGLVHFLMNVGDGPAKAIASFSSQNPGVLQVGQSVFGTDPPVELKILEKAFGLSQYDVQKIQGNFKGY